MEENKFRGKSTVNIKSMKIKKGDWVEGFLVYDDEDNPFIVGKLIEVNDEYTILEYWIPVDPKTVGQYRELKDKNGKEIHEGDILRSPANEFFEVFFYQGAFTVNGKVIASTEMIKYYEIVGNICDNPEFLGKEA